MCEGKYGGRGDPDNRKSKRASHPNCPDTGHPSQTARLNLRVVTGSIGSIILLGRFVCHSFVSTSPYHVW